MYHILAILRVILNNKAPYENIIRRLK